VNVNTLGTFLMRQSARLQDAIAEQNDLEADNEETPDAPSSAALQEACRCIAASSAADALGCAFQCGMPGFAVPLAAAVYEQVKALPLPGSSTCRRRLLPSCEVS